MWQGILGGVASAIILAVLGWIYTQTRSGLDAQETQKIQEIISAEIPKLTRQRLICKETEWGTATGCLVNPVATSPRCDDGWVYAGISAVTATDDQCGQSRLNNQKVKGLCCQIIPHQ